MEPSGASRFFTWTRRSRIIASQTECSRAIVVVQERALRVEGRVDVRQLDLAPVVPSELWQPSEAGQGVEGVTLDQEVVRRPTLADVTDRLHVLEQPNLGNSIVGRREPNVVAIVASEEGLLFVRPRELEPTLVPLHR